MRRIVAASGLTGLLAMAACAPAEPPLPDFGNAVRHNMAVHILNPDYEAPAAPTPMDGARAGVAIGRYRAGAATGTDALVKDVLSTSKTGK
ncbi:MAG: hypothetical protein IH626_06885 [Rhodospirillales bacterium]|nr:hypothetical protein [Rhodospirillales bacterium]